MSARSEKKSANHKAETSWSVRGERGSHTAGKRKQHDPGKNFSVISNTFFIRQPGRDFHVKTMLIVPRGPASYNGTGMTSSGVSCRRMNSFARAR